MSERARLGERRLLRCVRQAHLQEVSVRPITHGRQASHGRGEPGGEFGYRLPEMRRDGHRTALPRLRLPVLGPPAVCPPGRVRFVLLVRPDSALPLVPLALRFIPRVWPVLFSRAVLLRWAAVALRSFAGLGPVPFPGAVLHLGPAVALRSFPGLGA